MQPTDHKPPTPSLRGADTAMTDSRRILANLEQGEDGAVTGRPGWAGWSLRRGLAAAVLLLILAGAAWWCWRPAASTRAGVPPAATPAAPSPGLPAAIDGARETPPTERLAAAIVNEVPADRLPGRPVSVAPAAPAAPGASSLPGTPAATPHAGAAAQGKADGPPPAGPRVKPAPAAPVLPAGPADSDVVLLTALVAHASGQPSGLPNRDVVLRKEGDSTGALLERCKALGPIEGMLCRSRICSGRWDEDAACSR